MVYLALAIFTILLLTSIVSLSLLFINNGGNHFARLTGAIKVTPTTLEELGPEVELHEVTDPVVLSNISRCIPGLLKVGEGGEAMFNSVSLPVSRSGVAVMSIAGSVVSIAAMVVGQFYLKEIRMKLSEVSRSLDLLNTYQENEFKGKVFALLTHVISLTNFESEIIANPENRTNEINRLLKLEVECGELLAQASFNIESVTSKSPISFRDYESIAIYVQRWCDYQKILSEAMIQIACLKHALYLGAVSKEQCMSLIPTYAEQVKTSREKLALWHSEQGEKLGYDSSAKRRRRNGIDSAVHFVPGLFNKERRYRAVAEDTIRVINEQTNVEEMPAITKEDLFQSDVQLVGGKNKVFFVTKKKA
ncbi:MAG: hypothetical protein J6A47_02680 [Bacilli bacterium]|nr:hypothetical protein [Bacilli bacterium]